MRQYRGNETAPRKEIAITATAAVDPSPARLASRLEKPPVDTAASTCSTARKPSPVSGQTSASSSSDSGRAA